MNRLAPPVEFKRNAKVGICLLIIPLLSACRGPAGLAQGGKPALTISAASNLIPAFEEIGERFEDETSIEVEFNFGASGQLADQIIQGAPVDVFASADAAYINELLEEGLLVESSITEFARGRIVLWMAEGSNLELTVLQDLSQLSVETLMVANPAYAPFGKAAREALESAGMWDVITDKVVYGSYVSQTLHMAEAGSADAAIVALSLVIGGDGDWILIPETQHKPIRQVMAVLRGTEYKEEARAFIEFVKSETGQEILRRFGFGAVSP
jgi:molybdate transport system substrate-binding protein